MFIFLFVYFLSHSLEYKTLEKLILEGILIFFQDYDVVWYFQCLEQCLTLVFAESLIYIILIGCNYAHIGDVASE